MICFLEQQGFTVARIRGSHHVLERGRLHTTVPVHGSEILRLGTLRGVLRDVEMSPAEFIVLWDR